MSPKPEVEHDQVEARVHDSDASSDRAPTGNDMTVEDAGKVCEAISAVLRTHMVYQVRSA